ARRVAARRGLGQLPDARARAGLATPRHGHAAAAAEGDGEDHPVRRPAQDLRRLHRREGARPHRGGPERMNYRDFHRRSITDREGFWAEEAKRIHWQKPFGKVLDYARPPFAKWFVGGETNLCHNALDRHLSARADQAALVWISTEVNATKTY